MAVFDLRWKDGSQFIPDPVRYINNNADLEQDHRVLNNNYIHNYKDRFNEVNDVKVGKCLDVSLLLPASADAVDRFKDLYDGCLRYCIIHLYYERSPIKNSNPEAALGEAMRQADEQCRKHLYMNKDLPDPNGYIKDLAFYWLIFHWGSQHRGRLSDDIDNRLKGAPCYLRTRVKVVCLLFKKFPADLFDTENWADAFAAYLPHREDDYPVQNGQEFDLDFNIPQGVGLKPRSLYNDGDKVCGIVVKWEGIRQEIRIPPKGRLRALFWEDSESNHLVNIKGCLSFGPDAAIAQIPSDTNPDTMIIRQFLMNNETINETDGEYRYLLDAAPQGRRYCILFDNSIKRNDGTSVVDLRPNNPSLPARCYGAGNAWAYLYSDGCLLCCNAKNAVSRTGVVSVVEYKDDSLLFLKRDGTIASWPEGARDVTLKDFVTEMLRRFSADGLCESVSVHGGLRLSIQPDGTVVPNV